jgi:hypothetical protein
MLRCTTFGAAVQGGMDGAAEPLCKAAKGSAERVRGEIGSKREHRGVSSEGQGGHQTSIVVTGKR